MSGTRTSVEKYQMEEILESRGQFLTKETSTMVLNNFVENLLGLLSDMFRYGQGRGLYQAEFTHGTSIHVE